MELSVSNDIVSSKIYDQRGDSDFDIVTPFLTFDILRYTP